MTGNAAADLRARERHSRSEIERALRAADAPEDSMATDDDLLRYEGRAEAVEIFRDMLGLDAAPAPTEDRADTVTAAEEAVVRVRALWGGGDRAPVFLSDVPNKIVRATVRRRDLGCDVTESFLRLDDVIAAVESAAPATEDGDPT